MSAAIGSMTQGNVGYVVIDSRFIPPDRAQLVIDALQADRDAARSVPDALRTRIDNRSR